MMRKDLAGLLAVLALVGVASAAEAKPHRYGGGHPRTGEPAGGWCHVEVVHVHPAAPVHAEVLYRDHSGVYVFIGDPTPYGYEGPRHAFYGHHPVVLEVVLGTREDDAEDVEYCYHDGPHYHAYEPPPDVEFVEREEVHYYAGTYPPEYERERPQRVRVNHVYRPLKAERPVVHAAPPAEYRGPVVQVGVRLPVPQIEVAVGVPGVEIVTTTHREERVVVEHVHHERCDHPSHHKHKKHKKHKKWKDRD